MRLFLFFFIFRKTHIIYKLFLNDSSMDGIDSRYESEENIEKINMYIHKKKILNILQNPNISIIHKLKISNTTNYFDMFNQIFEN